MRRMFSLGAIGWMTGAAVMVAVPTNATGHQIAPFPESVVGAPIISEEEADATVSVRPREVPADAVVSVQPREVPAVAVVTVQPREVPGDAVVSVQPREVPAEATVSVQPRQVPGDEVMTAPFDQAMTGDDHFLNGVDGTHEMAFMSAPANSVANAVPEPATWTMMILGFWVAAWRLRRVNGGGRGPVPA